jgi:hypothetical protein
MPRVRTTIAAATGAVALGVGWPAAPDAGPGSASSRTPVRGRGSASPTHSCADLGCLRTGSAAEPTTGGAALALFRKH